MLAAIVLALYPLHRRQPLYYHSSSIAYLFILDYYCFPDGKHPRLSYELPRSLSLPPPIHPRQPLYVYLSSTAFHP